MTDESNPETNLPKVPANNEKYAKKRLALSISFLTRRIDRPVFEKLRNALEADPEFDVIAALEGAAGTIHIDPGEITEAVETLVSEANPDDQNTERTLAELTEALTQLEKTLGSPTFKDPLAPDDQESTEAGTAFEGETERTDEFTISERYRFLEILKVGGQALVCLAQDVELNRTVAIKIPHSKGRSLESACRMIVVEARITGLLNRPSVIPIYALEKRADGRPFLVLPYYPQGEFTREIKQLHPGIENRKISPGDQALKLRGIVQSMVQLCRAVESAHDEGIVHRDIKPGNILLGDYGEVFLADWGLAKNLRKPARSTQQEKTEPSSPSGSISTEYDYTDFGGGTAIYMSKEQALGEIELQNEKTDIFLLGATLYSMIYGRPPFKDRTAAASYDVEFPRSSVRGIDWSLIGICKKAMAELQPDRYPTAADLASDLERWLADQPLLFVDEKPSKKIARFSRRYSRSFAAAAMTLMAGTVGLLIMNDRIATARDNETIAKNKAIASERREAKALADTIKALENETIAKEKAVASERLEAAARKQTEVARKREAESFNLALFMARYQFEVIAQKLPFVPGTEKIRFEVARTLCQNYDILMKLNPDRDDIFVSAIAAEREAGNMGRFLGDKKIPQAHFERALELCHRLIKKHPEKMDHQLRIALVLMDYSRFLDMIGDIEMAEKRCDEGLDFLKKLRANGKNPLFDELEIILLWRKSGILSLVGREKELDDCLNRFETLHEGWFGKFRKPTPQDIKIAVGVKLTRANYHLRADRFGEARDAFVKAYEEASAHQDRDQDFRLLMGDAQFGKARALLGLKDPVAVEQSNRELQQVFETMSKLQKDSPDVKVYAEWVATIATEMLRFERLNNHKFENALDPGAISKLIEKRIEALDGPDPRLIRAQFLTEQAYREKELAKRQELAAKAAADLDYVIEKLPLRNDFHKDRELIRKDFEK